MLKKLRLFLGLTLLVFAPVTYAYDLTLTKVGSMSTIGADYSLVSYVGAVPTLEGTATPAAQVSVKVNTVTNSVLTATASGVWQFLPTTLNTGDNNIVISSGSQQITFVLRFNSTSTASAVVATNSASVTALPESGTVEYVVGVGVIGVLLLLFGRKMKNLMHEWESGVK